MKMLKTRFAQQVAVASAVAGASAFTFAEGIDTSSIVTLITGFVTNVTAIGGAAATVVVMVKGFSMAWSMIKKI